MSVSVTEKLIEKSKEAFLMAIELEFNSYCFSLFCKYYNIKDNLKLCYAYKLHAQPQYSYSLQAIDFIVDEIKKDPENIIQNLKNKKNKPTPGAKEF